MSDHKLWTEILTIMFLSPGRPGPYFAKLNLVRV
jgi:hypothetical protein